ncbi:unnamed protein product [Boreogadus saida]
MSLKMESSSGCVDDGGGQGVVVLRSERPTLSRCVGSLFTMGMCRYMGMCSRDVSGVMRHVMRYVRPGWRMCTCT